MANTKRGQNQMLSMSLMIECVLALVWFIQSIQPLYSCCYFGEYENRSSESVHQTEERKFISCKQLGYMEERKQLDESCDVHLQCSGTENAGVCGESRTCSCNEGFLKIQKECLPGNLTFGQSCTHDIQCTGMEDWKRCRGGRCNCKQGFILQRQTCLLVPGHNESMIVNEENKYELFLVVGIGLVGVLVIFSTILLVLKMRHSDKKGIRKDRKEAQCTR